MSKNHWILLYASTQARRVLWSSLNSGSSSLPIQAKNPEVPLWQCMAHFFFSWRVTPPITLSLNDFQNPCLNVSISERSPHFIYTIYFTDTQCCTSYTLNSTLFTWRLTNSWYAFHFPHHPSHHPSNEKCLKLLLGVCNTKEMCYLSMYISAMKIHFLFSFYYNLINMVMHS